MFKRFSQSHKKSGCLQVQLTRQGEFVDSIHIALNIVLHQEMPIHASDKCYNEVVYFYTGLQEKLNICSYMVYKLCILVFGTGL